MDSPPSHSVMRLPIILLKCWGIMILLLFPYMATDGFHTDQKVHLAKLVENSDYTTTFYVSGKLALESKIKDLYPVSNQVSIHETEYNRRAHEILPNMTPSLTAICPYFPLVPFLFLPLTFMPPAYALLTWQFLSLCALFVSSIMIDKLRNQSAVSTFWLALLFMPVIHCLVVGQSAILLGLLPLTTGFFMLQKKRPFLAGLIFSITFLKPQLFLAALFITLCMLFRKSYKPLAGIVSGAVSLCLVALITLGPETMQRWIGGMQVVDSVYSVAKNGVIQTIVASVPRMIILSAPADALMTVKLCVLALSAFLFAVALFGCFKLAQRCDDDSEYANSILLVALSLVPLIAPYLFIYDLSALLLAWAAIRSHRSVLLAVIYAIYVNLYGIIVIVPPLAKLATPWLLLLLYLEMYRRTVLAAFGNQNALQASSTRD